MSSAHYQRSREVLQALVQGIDPKTGDELSKDTVLNRVDVLRALLTAVEALEAVNARLLRRAQLPESVGKTWSEDEERHLKEEYRKQKMSIPDIAVKHGRTVRAIEARLEKLGLLRAGDRTIGANFMGGPDTKEDQV